MHIKYAQRQTCIKDGDSHAASGCSFTYLLTPVTFDRDYSALQIINQYRSIIIEAVEKAELKGMQFEMTNC